MERGNGRTSTRTTRTTRTTSSPAGSAISRKRCIYVSPPDRPPHHVWYISGELGCAMGESYDVALRRYWKLEEYKEGTYP